MIQGGFKMDKRVKLIISISVLVVVVIGGIFGVIMLNQSLSGEQQDGITMVSSSDLAVKAVETSGTYKEEALDKRLEPNYGLINGALSFNIVNGVPTYMDVLEEKGQTKYSIINAITSEEIYSFTVSEKANEEIAISNYAVNSSGDVFVVYQRYIFQAGEVVDSTAYYQLNPKKFQTSKNDILLSEVKVIGDGSDTAREMMIDDEYIYISSNGTLLIFDYQGKPIRSTGESGETMEAFDLDGKGNIFILYQGGHIEKQDIISGEIIWKKNTTERTKNICYLAATDELSYLDYLDNREIIAISGAKGDSERKLFDFIASAPSMIDRQQFKFAQDFFIDAQNNVSVLATWSEGDTEKPEEMVQYIQNFRYTAIPKSEIQEAFTFTVPYKDEFLETAIAKYAAKTNIQVKLDYVYPSRENYYGHSKEYNDQLMTRLLANDVGSLVQTGGLKGMGVEALFQTDMFMDIKSMVEQDPNYADLNKSSINGLVINGKLRGLPMGMKYESLDISLNVAEKLNIDPNADIKWSEILALAKKLEAEKSDIRVFSGGPTFAQFDYLFSMFLQSNLRDLINTKEKTVDLHQDWFVSLLKEWKSLKKSYHLFSPTIFSKDVTSILAPKSLFAYRTVEEIIPGVGPNLSTQHENARNIGIPFMRIPAPCGEKNNNRMGFSNNVYSIPSQATNKEEAWDFLSFLLTEEIQQLDSLNGVAINLAAGESKFSGYIKANSNRYPSYEGEMAEYSQLVKVYKSADYQYNGFYEEDIVSLNDYMNDKLSLEEALDQAQQKIWIRINE